MPEKTITIKEANERVKTLLTESLSALPDTLDHEIQFKKTRMSCANPGTDGPSGLVQATTDYKITNVSPQEIPTYFTMMRKWWTDHNYKILKDTPRNEYIWVEHNPDGFRMALEANDFGEVYLGATSPCVWPNGTPEPEG